MLCGDVGAPSERNWRRPGLVFRQAELDEAMLIGDLRLASLLSLEMPGRDLQHVATLMRMLPDADEELVASGRYLVADRDGELLGGAGWSVLPLRFQSREIADPRGDPLTLAPRSVLVRGFFLDPDQGRRGVGTVLLDRIEREASAVGFVSADIVVPDTAQPVYRGLGFRSAGPLRLGLPLGGHLPLVQMRRPFRQGEAMA